MWNREKKLLYAIHCYLRALYPTNSTIMRTKYIKHIISVYYHSNNPCQCFDIIFYAKSSALFVLFHFLFPLSDSYSILFLEFFLCCLMWDFKRSPIRYYFLCIFQDTKTPRLIDTKTYLRYRDLNIFFPCHAIHPI